MTTNIAPVEGTFASSPTSGFAATTAFVLSFSGWVDVDSSTLIYPLAYKVWYQQADASVILYSGTSPTVITALPLGDGGVDTTTLTVFASVTDSTPYRAIHLLLISIWSI
jgi:hypothetical protein